MGIYSHRNKHQLRITIEQSLVFDKWRFFTTLYQSNWDDHLEEIHLIFKNEVILDKAGIGMILLLQERLHLHHKQLLLHNPPEYLTLCLNVSGQTFLKSRNATGSNIRDREAFLKQIERYELQK